MTSLSARIMAISVLLTVSLWGQESQTFRLKSGDIISGKVVAQDDSSFQVLTSFGVVEIAKNNLKLDRIEIGLKDGNRLQGELLERTPEGVTIRTAMGDLYIEASQIDRLDVLTEADKPESARGQRTYDENAKWYFSDERLMDIWFDPTGFSLEKGTLYLSGLSWAVGLNDNIQVSSAWSNYFWGDLNIRPKITLLETGTIDRLSSFAIGGHLHTRGLPNKFEYTTKTYIFDNYDYSSGTVISQDTTYEDRWVQIGSGNEVERYDQDYSNDYNQPWTEVFLAYSISLLNPEEKGRTNHTFGASLIMYPGEPKLPRVYYGFDKDIRRNIKIMAEIFYDPYYAPLFSRINESRSNSSLPLFFDFGFITNAIFPGEKLWLGIHYQQPFVSLYFKF